MAELCEPKDMCVGDDIKCSNLGEEPRRECRIAGKKKYLQGVDRGDWPSGDCHEWLARDATEDGICGPARQCYSRCVFSGENSGQCTSYATHEQLTALICATFMTYDECEQESKLDLEASPGLGETWTGTYCCPVFEAIDGTYPACTWERNAREDDGTFMKHGPFDKCMGKKAPLGESAGRIPTYLVEPALAKRWCGDIENEADCEAKQPCVWQYKELTCKKSSAKGFWDRGGVFVMADPDETCNYPGCWGEEDDK